MSLGQGMKHFCSLWRSVNSFSYLLDVVCLDRVDTKFNPVDGLSRGRLKGPWCEVIPLA